MGRPRRARRCCSSSLKRSAAPAIDLFTVAVATRFFRSIVIAIAMPTTTTITMAVATKSFQTRGTRGRSIDDLTMGPVLGSAGVGTATSILARAGSLIRSSLLVLVLHRAELPAIDGQGHIAADAVLTHVDHRLGRAALLVPRDEAITPHGYIERVAPRRIGESVVRRRHHVNDGRHVRMDIAVNIDDPRRIELVCLSRPFPIQAEVEGVSR